MEKINIAELLKDCPKGMELDCVLFNNPVTLDEVVDIDEYICPIVVNTEDGDMETFTKYGQYLDREYAKCIIFPKGKTTWEGFVPPCKFKDGDIIYVKDKYDQEWCSILSNYTDNKLYTYVDFCINSNEVYYNKPNILCEHKDIIEYRLATEKEKEKLFNAIKDNDYKWNVENKTLEKLSKSYKLNKFNINTLVPFKSKVLVRDNDIERWRPTFWGFYDNDDSLNYPYECVGNAFAQCIPYEGNEHLLGTNNKCDNYYKTWNDYV